MPRILPVLALAALTSAACSSAAPSVAGPALTIYHADGDALFSGNSQGNVDAGYAVMHETRVMNVQAGRQTLHLGGLPATVDPEAVETGFGEGVQILGRRIVLANGNAGGVLAGQIGQHVEVAGDTGQPLAAGTLVGTDENGLAVRLADGRIVLIHNYATVTLAPGSASGGGSLLLDVNAKSAGAQNAKLSYTTSGLGWRAAYTATLAGGEACRMHFDPQASIANRSGRDYSSADVKLVAGQANLSGGPRVMLSMARAAPATEAAPSPMPRQAALGDYRSYTLPGHVDLPDGTVTLTPLYTPQDLPCVRDYVIETGNTWHPPKPLLNADYDRGNDQDRQIAATLSFVAPDALPAGSVRALTMDRGGVSELLGQGDIPDTPKDRQVRVTLGQSFDLRASRERIAFTVDKAAHTMDEAFRITLTNGGNAARIVTVREHPSRWRVWKRVSSSIAPDKQTPDLLEFKVNVPANGKTVLDYRVQYAWTAKDD